MSSYYNTTYAYPSKFVPEKLFSTIVEVRTHDRAFAAEFIGALTAEQIAEAFVVRNEGLLAVLAFVSDEAAPYAASEPAVGLLRHARAL